MSMISQGTWQPRPSMASRPGSMHPSHRPSGSYSGGNRGSYFANPDHRQSTYSHSGSAVGVSSPLRPPPPAEMRQTGQGERSSRVSFAAGETMHKPRPSFASNTRSSLHQSQLRHLAFLPGEGEPLPSTSPQHSPQLSRSADPTFGSGGVLSRSGSSSLSLAVTAPESDYFSRSGTREELASVHSPSSQSLGSFSRPYGHAQKPSVASSLRHELNGLPALAVVRDGRLAYSHPGDRTPPATPAADPFTAPSQQRTSPSSSLRPKPSLASLSTESLPHGPTATTTMPRAFGDPSQRESRILSPDEALASYAREVTSPTPSASAQRGAAKGGFAWPGRLLRSFTGGSIAGVLAGKDRDKDKGAGAGAGDGRREKAEGGLDEKREGARSPFEDPLEDDSDQQHAVAYDVRGEPVSRPAQESQESLIDEKGGMGRAV